MADDVEVYQTNIVALRSYKRKANFCKCQITFKHPQLENPNLDNFA